MGGGDLNLKKSWHPLTYQNQERIWKEEQKAKEEEKKLEQLRKELEEERQIQELLRLKESTGYGKRQERVDWMYSCGPGYQAVLTEDRESYLLGKRKIDHLLETKDSEKFSTSAFNEGFLSMNQQANTARDTMNKVREDPLLWIKKREQMTIESVLKNPLKMRELEKKKRRHLEEKSKKHKNTSPAHAPVASEKRRYNERDRSPTTHNHSHRHNDHHYREYQHHQNQHESTRDEEKRRSSYRRDEGHSSKMRQAEREMKLKEMMETAAQLDEDRAHRLKRDEQEERKQEEEERSVRAKSRKEAGDYNNIIKNVSAMSKDMDLSERLKRSRPMLQSHEA